MFFHRRHVGLFFHQGALTHPLPTLAQKPGEYMCFLAIHTHLLLWNNKPVFLVLNLIFFLGV
jgi:hypothetical protein